MKITNSRTKLFLVAATAMAVGALAGGIAVALATQAIPKMMNRVMSGMCQNMMSKMKTAGGASPGG